MCKLRAICSPASGSPQLLVRLPLRLLGTRPHHPSDCSIPRHWCAILAFRGAGVSPASSTIPWFASLLGAPTVPSFHNRRELPIQRRSVDTEMTKDLGGEEPSVRAAGDKKPLERMTSIQTKSHVFTKKDYRLLFPSLHFVNAFYLYKEKMRTIVRTVVAVAHKW